MQCDQLFSIAYCTANAINYSSALMPVMKLTRLALSVVLVLVLK